jgi:excisionase family DNA binding protein
MPVIFNLTDIFFPVNFEKVKTIPIQETTVTTTTKDRRIDYPEEMNAEEAAEYLNTTKKNLYQMTSSRIVPHYKRGRKLMFRKSELENWHIEKITSVDEQKTQSANHLLSRKKKR